MKSGSDRGGRGAKCQVNQKSECRDFHGEKDRLHVGMHDFPPGVTALGKKSFRGVCGAEAGSISSGLRTFSPPATIALVCCGYREPSIGGFGFEFEGAAWLARGVATKV